MVRFEDFQSAKLPGTHQWYNWQCLHLQHTLYCSQVLASHLALPHLVLQSSLIINGKTHLTSHTLLCCDMLWKIKWYSLFDARFDLKTIAKGFYRKWVKSSFDQFITTQTWVGSTNRWIISQNAQILKFYFSTISGNLWCHHMAKFRRRWP